MSIETDPHPATRSEPTSDQGPEHRTAVTVRGYEIDALGHVAHTVYLQYAEHARWDCLDHAGLGASTLLGAGVMPVILETKITYRRELRYNDEVAIGCVFEWGDGATARILQRIVRSRDGQVAAEVVCVAGLLDLARRELVGAPKDKLRAIADAPDRVGL